MALRLARKTYVERLDFNNIKKQLVCKWSTRFGLGTSTSMPALLFRQQDIFFIPDIGESASLGILTSS